MLFSGVSLAEETAAPTLTALYHPDYPSPIVEAHEPTDDAYFADAVFIGDSMMEYVEMLDEIPTANFVWKIGMSPASVGRKQFTTRDSNTRLTTFEVVAQYNPRKIYVMLGSNGLDHAPVQNIVEDYERLSDALITHFPDALIYVITSPPMSRKRMTGDNHIPTKRYANFADELLALAERRHFYYIDLYHLVVNEQGYLPLKYDCGDGYHLSTSAYSMLLEQVRIHTVPYPNLPDERGESR